MAGSYRHCVGPDGRFIGDSFTDMIENLGDAYEACEEMFFMIDYLADGDKGMIENALQAFYEERKRGR